MYIIITGSLYFIKIKPYIKVRTENNYDDYVIADVVLHV